MTPESEVPRLVVRDRAWASALQHSLDDFMYEVYDALDDVDVAVSGTVSVSGESEPFCGCQSCEGRLTVSFLAPRIIKGFLDGKLDVVGV